MDRLLLRPHERLTQYVERIAIYLAVPSGVLVALLVIALNWQRNPVPFLEDLRGFGAILLIAIAPLAWLSGALAFVLGTKAWNARVPQGYARGWAWGVIPISFVYGLLLVIFTLALLALAEVGFRNLALGRFQASMLTGAICSALLHWMIKQVMELTAGKLLQLTIILLAGGIYVAMAEISDPFWWRISFSYLGSVKSNAYVFFNTTLIFVGIMFLVWLPYLMPNLKVLVAHEHMSARAALYIQIAVITLAIAIIGVGLLRRGFTPLESGLHNVAAYTMSAVLIFLMAGLPWLVPALPAEVQFTSWLMVIAIIFAVVAGLVGYFNTVGVELSSFILGMAWIQNFVRNVEIQARATDPNAFPT